MSVKPTEDWVVIRPQEGETASAVAGVLLALAEDPADVRTILGGSAFLVPPELAASYAGPRSTQSRPRRGRAKKGETR